MIVVDWSQYTNFAESEFRCKHTGRCVMRRDFLDVLQAIRNAYGKPIRIMSGYRDPSHPVERIKRHGPGEHSLGLAADVAVSGADALELLRVALAHGIRRVGVQQKGEGRFLHLGLGGPGIATPAIWSY